ncbi:hypothetical protein [Microbulbifer taiwanensis]
MNVWAGFATWVKVALCALLVSAWAPAASAAQNPYTMIEGFPRTFWE